MRALKLGVASIGVALAGVVVPASAASASPINASCGPALDPYSYTSQSQRVSLEDAGQNGGLATLYSSTTAPYQGGRIEWTWGHGLRAGDVVSLDWSDDGGANWHYCHSTVASGHTSTTTKAVNQWGDRFFRACLKRSGSGWVCTDWWT